ncbi:hypothetical protein TrVGV298_002827 [Trichoderma virens]|nr:hypothetical protein TrVGV298_002827 [Trichoderma virens]
MKPSFFLTTLRFFALGAAAPSPLHNSMRSKGGDKNSDNNSGPDLSKYNLTATLPIVYFPPPYTWPNYAPSLTIYLHAPQGWEFSNVSSTVPLMPILDTGSTGLMLDALDLNITNATLAKFEPGYQYLSSSTKLYRGAWIPFRLDFANPTGESANVTAEIPVLVVNETLLCSEYNNRWKSDCPPEKTTKHNLQPRGIQWWGIGFGRESDGQLQGTPDKNALLNIKTINGVDVSTSGNYRVGYSLRKNGVVVGLTEENTQDYTWTKLKKHKGFSKHPFDWRNVSGCVSIDGGSCETSNILVDTGNTRSYLSTTDRLVHLVPSNTSSTAKVLEAGQNVLVRFGSEVGYEGVQYNFTIGNKSTLEPDEVRTKLVKKGREEKINTGVYFYREWESAFDADEAISTPHFDTVLLRLCGVNPIGISNCKGQVRYQNTKFRAQAKPNNINISTASSLLTMDTPLVELNQVLHPAEVPSEVPHLDRLPTELVELICSWILAHKKTFSETVSQPRDDKWLWEFTPCSRTLASLSLASKRYRQIAHPYLYSQISIGESDNTWLPRFVSLLCRKPDLGLLIKEIDIQCLPKAFSVEPDSMGPMFNDVASRFSLAPLSSWSPEDCAEKCSPKHRPCDHFKRLLTLLAFLAPNVKRWRMVPPNIFHFEELVQVTEQAFTRSMPSPSNPRALKSLQHLWVPGAQPFPYATDFFALEIALQLLGWLVPSLQKLWLRNASLYHPLPARIKLDNLKEIVIDFGLLTEGGLFSLTRACKVLESFCFCSGGNSPAFPDGWGRAALQQTPLLSSCQSISFLHFPILNAPSGSFQSTDGMALEVGPTTISISLVKTSAFMRPGLRGGGRERTVSWAV